MSEIASVPFNSLTGPKLSTCPICAGTKYEPRLYDKLCHKCRQKLLWLPE